MSSVTLWDNLRRRTKEIVKEDPRFSLPEKLRNTKYTNELLLAIPLALKAGRNMLPHFDSKGTTGTQIASLEISTKANRNDFATAIDRENEEFMMKEIREKFPEDFLIGEETTGVGAIPKLTSNKTWILDPIDGTTNFANGLPLSCVSVGLCDKRQPVMGCIYVPMTQELYLAVKGHGAYRNGQLIRSSSSTDENKRLRDAVVVFEFGNTDGRDPTGVDKMLAVVRKLLLGGVQASRQLGSGVLDLCYVASGRVNLVYAGIHDEGWKPWDYCAGVVVAREAGAVVKSIYGRPGKEGVSDEFDPVTGAVLKNAPDFDIYSKSVICGSTSQLVAECRNIILSCALENKQQIERLKPAQNPQKPALKPQSMRTSTLVEQAVPTAENKYHRFANVYAAPVKLVEDFVAPVFDKHSDEIEFLQKVLSDNFIFSGLTPQEQTLIINAMQSHKVHVNENIMKQGDAGDYFYVLNHGKVEFYVSGKKVGEAVDGATFGELALLYDAPRAATVKAVTDCNMYRVDQNTFRSVLANTTAQSEKKSTDLLSRVEIFSGLESAELAKIAENMTNLVIHDGHTIFRKGEVGEVFYIIKDGKVKISDIGLGEAKYVSVTLEKGEFFGERALMTGECRAGTASAVGAVSLLCISKETFETVMGSLEKLISHSLDKRKIMGVPIFAKAKLESHEVERLSNMIASMTLGKGQIFLQEGKPVTEISNGLYFVKEGEISVSSSKRGVNSLKSGDYFGEDMIHKDPKFVSASTFTVVENAVLTFVTVEDIKTALGDLNRLQRMTSAMFNKLDSSITLDKLKKITILGSGTFGQVWLVTHKETNHPYALKIQTKRELIESGQAAGVVREKNLMASIDHPFVAKLANAFQDKDSLFMVLQLAQGGELFNVLHTDRTDGVDEASARFYAANIYDGLMHMHGRRILYRDLKPENALIDADGYCVLIDLGFAKVVTDKTYTLCGTPLYLAPEIILSRGYDKSVDNWAFGVLVYEMIFGNAPFYTPNMDQMKLFKRIVKVHYKFPDRTSASAEAKDMISKILVLHPSRRLGSFAGGGDDIRNHPWLTSITPSSLLAREVQAPWKPKIKSPTDTSNFDNWDHLQDKMTAKYAPLSEAEEHQFDEF